MWGVSKNPSQLPNKKQEKGGLAESFRPENFIPGLIIGFIFGLFLDLSNPSKNQTKKKIFLPGKSQQQSLEDGDKELKMVFVVRQDLKMGAGKIASQCAHAATGMYAELIYRYAGCDNADLCNSKKLRVTQYLYTLQPPDSLETMGAIWTAQNSCYMQESTRNLPNFIMLKSSSLSNSWSTISLLTRNKIREAAENFGLPTFVVADAGRTQLGQRLFLLLDLGQKNQLTQLQGNCGFSNVMEIKDCLSGQISEVNRLVAFAAHSFSFHILEGENLSSVIACGNVQGGIDHAASSCLLRCPGRSRWFLDRPIVCWEKLRNGKLICYFFVSFVYVYIYGRCKLHGKLCTPNHCN
ncbi:hypothetical protein SADUNF_Sadunf06G0190500 [Salix dunnii]|uniref:peptidyl-tRNA hydrolase n=1 Tax=Salix dunnii TaxID=1413687 RepID=A0A835K857_9ROSI|nr:hypothetical protein SADUNF_Sadunf06G0190500 [Salix dunnii]